MTFIFLTMTMTPFIERAAADKVLFYWQLAEFQEKHPEFYQELSAEVHDDEDTSMADLEENGDKNGNGETKIKPTKSAGTKRKSPTSAAETEPPTKRAKTTSKIADSNVPEKNKVKENKEKHKETDKEKGKEKGKEKDKEKDKEKGKEKGKEKDKEKEKGKDKEKEKATPKPKATEKPEVVSATKSKPAKSATTTKTPDKKPTPTTTTTPSTTNSATATNSGKKAVTPGVTKSTDKSKTPSSATAKPKKSTTKSS